MEKSKSITHIACHLHIHLYMITDSGRQFCFKRRQQERAHRCRAFILWDDCSGLSFFSATTKLYVCVQNLHANDASWDPVKTLITKENWSCAWINLLIPLYIFILSVIICPQCVCASRVEECAVFHYCRPPDWRTPSAERKGNSLMGLIWKSSSRQ